MNVKDIWPILESKVSICVDCLLYISPILYCKWSSGSLCTHLVFCNQLPPCLISLYKWLHVMIHLTRIQTVWCTVILGHTAHWDTLRILYLWNWFYYELQLYVVNNILLSNSSWIHEWNGCVVMENGAFLWWWVEILNVNFMFLHVLHLPQSLSYISNATVGCRKQPSRGSNKIPITWCCLFWEKWDAPGVEWAHTNLDPQNPSEAPIHPWRSASWLG